MWSGIAPQRAEARELTPADLRRPRDAIPITTLSQNHSIKIVKEIMLRSLVKAAARSFGVDLRRYDPLNSADLRLAHFLSMRHVDLVLDIGANRGQFAQSLRTAGYEGRIASFEPLTTAWEELNRRAASDPLWDVAPRMAIGNVDGEIEIHVAGNSESSSVLDMLASHVNAEPQSAYVGVEKVALRRLDSAAVNYVRPGSKLFIKIDTQGFEAQVIDGAGELLKHATGVNVEVSFVPLYEGQVLYLGIISALQSAGLEIWDLAPVFVDPQSFRLLQGNAIFFRD